MKTYPATHDDELTYPRDEPNDSAPPMGSDRCRA